MAEILVIEDDKDLNRGICFTFEKEGYEVYSAYGLLDAASLFEKHRIELILLDLNLPDGDGIEFCRRIREKTDLPVIILTARDLETDEVMGLESGADDYITKPFSLAVLKARVAAVLRRKGNHELEDRFMESNGIRLDKKKMKVMKQEEEICCSITEFKLLRMLMEHKNQVLLKNQILYQIWDQDANFVDENTLPVNVRRLRMKLEEEPSNPKWIKTVHGMGYIWMEDK